MNIAVLVAYQYKKKRKNAVKLFQHTNTSQSKRFRKFDIVLPAAD